MSVIYKVITRPTDPRVPNSPKRYYPHLITLGQSVNLKYIAQKMQDRSSLSVGDIKSVIQNFVEKMKEQLLEGKSINIEGLGVFMLTARSKGAELAKDINAKSVDSVRIFFQANKELRVTKTATRADEKLDLISLDEYLKKNSYKLVDPLSLADKLQSLKEEREDLYKELDTAVKISNATTTIQVNF